MPSENIVKTVITPTGSLSAGTATAIRAELKSLVDVGNRDLTLDLADVQMVDSIGLSVLFAAHNSLKKNGGKLTLVNTSKGLRSLFTRTGLNRHVSIISTA
jgi:anti-anti-sigma factor